MQEAWVPSLGWEDPLEKDMATDSSILVWGAPWMGSLVGSSPPGVGGRKGSDTTEQLSMHASSSLTVLREFSPETGTGRVWEGGCSATGICASQFVLTSEACHPWAANPTRTENCLCGWPLPLCARRLVRDGSTNWLARQRLGWENSDLARKPRLWY